MLLHSSSWRMDISSGLCVLGAPSKDPASRASDENRQEHFGIHSCWDVWCSEVSEGPQRCQERFLC